MKVKKGGVVIAILPTELKRYKLAGWVLVQEKTVEEIKIMNEKARLKRLAKGGS